MVCSLGCKIGDIGNDGYCELREIGGCNRGDVKTGGKAQAVNCPMAGAVSLVTGIGGSSSDIKLLLLSLFRSEVVMRSVKNGASGSGWMSIGGGSAEIGGSGRGGCGGADRAALRDDEENWNGAI